MSDRYHRQELLWGAAGQQTLRNSTLAVVGEDSFAFPAALNAALAGVPTRLLLTGKSTQGSRALDFTLGGANLSLEYLALLSKINPLVRLSQLSVGLHSSDDSHFLEGVDAIIDLTNNPVSKKVGLEFALEHGAHFNSVSCVPGYTILETGTFSPEYGRFSVAPKDKFLAWPIGALAVEKAITFILGNESAKPEPLFLKPGFTYPFSPLADGENPRSIHRLSPGKTALVVGVGGQGSFAIPILAELGYDMIFYMDPDIVEEHNLHRQPWYWNSVGEFKAEVCAQKHNKIAGKTVAYPLVQKFDEHFDFFTDIDIIFGFTDTLYSRMLMSNYSAEHNITFITAGSDPGGADFCTYIPSKTTCFTHLRQGQIEAAKEEEREIRTSCMRNPNPQVVMPNCFAGSLAAILSAFVFDQDDTPFNGRLTYRPDLNPSFGRLTSPDACDCHRSGPLDIHL